MSTNGLAGVQSDLAPCAAEAQLLCNTAPPAVHGCILPPSQLLFATLYINIRRYISHTWRQNIGLHQRSEVLAPTERSACTVRKQRLLRRIKGHSLMLMARRAVPVGIGSLRAIRIKLVLFLAAVAVATGRRALPNAVATGLPGGSPHRRLAAREICTPHHFTGKTNLLYRATAGNASGNEIVKRQVIYRVHFLFDKLERKLTSTSRFVYFCNVE